MPEEINRVLTDHVSTLLFCPTQTAVENLRRENLTRGVYNAGDVMYDATRFNSDIADRKNEVLSNLQLNGRDYVLVTVHRAENPDHRERLENILKALKKVAQERYTILFPVHPRTRKMIDTYQLDTHPIQLIPPASYLDILVLLKHATIAVTDSGGLQKEACFLQTPCVTVREETEWIETVQTGWNIVTGTNETTILNGIDTILKQERKPVGDAFGNCDASRKIVRILAEHLFA